MASEIPSIFMTVQKLKLLVPSTDREQILEELDNVRLECDKDLTHRVMAGKQGVYNIILDLLLSQKDDRELIVLCLKTMIALMTTQPDLLTETGVQLMCKYIELKTDQEILLLVLKWMKECCIKQEVNREDIFNAGFLDYLKPLLTDEKVHSEVLREALMVLRALVLDDDVRVEFGGCYERAHIIGTETISTFIDLVSKYKDNEDIVSDLMLTLSTFIATDEFCKKFLDGGGLDPLLEVLRKSMEIEKLNRQALKLLKILALNDECKVSIVQKGGHEVIASSLNKYKGTTQTVIIGLNCIATLTLRQPNNGKILFEAGFAPIIAECMKLYPDNLNVQKAASWAIRNMVSRNRNHTDKFLSQGVAEILKENLKKFQKTCEFDTKAALRELGCREEWGWSYCKEEDILG